MTVPNGNEPVQGQEVQTPPPGTDLPQAQAPEEPASPWHQYLEPLPDSVRPLVEPVFKTWDADVTKRFQSLHSEYDPYKPVIDAWEPDALQQVTAMFEAMQEDPAAFIAQVAEAYGLTEQGTAEQPQVQPVEDFNQLPSDPRLEQMEQIVTALAEAFVGQREQETAEQTAAQEDAQLESVLADLKERHGEYDETYVVSLIAQGVDPEQAVGMFKQTVSQWATKQNAPGQQAPQVVGAGGGGYPSQQVDPSQLDDKATRDLVVQLLAAANAQEQGT